MNTYRNTYTISQEMHELMMHMIGYVNDLEGCFIDALDSYDPKLIVELAEQCEAAWGNPYTTQLKEAILVKYIAENESEVSV